MNSPQSRTADLTSEAETSAASEREREVTGSTQRPADEDVGSKIRIILHGRASVRDDVRAVIGALRERGHELEVRVTWESGDARRLAREAVEHGVSTLVAGGGDGTIHEVVTGVFDVTESIDERPTLGVIPLGTGNDFSGACEIPLDPAEAFDVILHGKAVPIDIGRVQDHCLVNVATGGFGPRITEETSEELKRLLGGAAYVVAGLTKLWSLSPVEADFRGPEFTWNGYFSVLAIGNARQAGGGNILCPHALVDDGLLDVRILPMIPQSERGRFIQELVTHDEAALESRIVTARLPWIEMRADQPLHMHLDGESFERTQLRFDVDPLSLRLHLPSRSPVLRRSDRPNESSPSRPSE